MIDAINTNFISSTGRPQQKENPKKENPGGTYPTVIIYEETGLPLPEELGYSLDIWG